MATVTLTVRYLDQLKPQSKRYEVFDLLVPGLAIRVTPAGHKSFTLWRRLRHRRGIHGMVAVLGPNLASSLIPGADARLGEVRLQEWLNQPVLQRR